LLFYEVYRSRLGTLAEEEEEEEEILVVVVVVVVVVVKRAGHCIMSMRA
jgi:hypothetical protein